MAGDILIGVDAGTSVMKTVAFSLQGEQIAVAALPNAYDNLGGGKIEQDMERTWRDCAATIAELGERIPNLKGRVAAIAVTAQGDGCWLVDRDGRPAGGGLLWLDSRRLQSPPRMRRAQFIRATTSSPVLASTPAWRHRKWRG